MKITIDISQIIYGTGVSVYTENLVRNLLKIDTENQYVLFGGSLRRIAELSSKAEALGSNSSVKIFPIPPTLSDIIWNRLHVVPIEALVGKVDVFHSSDWSQPPSKAFKVTTVHDLSPLKFSKFTNPKVISAHRRRLARVQKEVDRVIVPSHATQKDLVELGFDQKIIRVIPEAPDSEFKVRSSQEVDEIKRKYQIRGNYIISVGVGGRKNTDRLIRAYEQAKVGEDYSLVLVGRGSNKLEEQRGVRMLGQVSGSDLAALYSGAKLLLYPSLYEGFGLPILQAFACRCPVVTSNLSSMPEVAGDAGVLVDPYDVGSIVDGIKRALKEKDDLIKKGYGRAKEFSWEKTARETLEVYKETTGRAAR